MISSGLTGCSFSLVVDDAINEDEEFYQLYYTDDGDKQSNFVRVLVNCFVNEDVVVDLPVRVYFLGV